jgi:tetratricopeptide (TPR) repeat protein
MTPRIPLTLRLITACGLVAACALSLPGWADAQSGARRDTTAEGGIIFHHDEAAMAQMTDEEKIAALNEKVLANPRDGKAWNDLGVLLAGQENFDAARDAFIRAVQCEPKNGDYHRNLGVTFSRLDMHDMAVAEFGEYRKHDEMGGRDYWRLIGGAQKRAGLTDDARKTYREGLKMLGQPAGPEALRLVVALNQLEDEQGDEQAVRDLLTEYTPPAKAFLKGLEGRDDPEAQDGWMEAKSIVHNRVTMMVDDAKLLEDSGLPDEAAKLYDQAYKLAPERDDLLPRLVECYLKEGKQLEAGVAARLARDQHPDKAGTWIATGKVYEQQPTKLEDAVAAYEKAYEIEQLDDLRVAIGNLHMRLGNDAEASKWLRAGISSGDTKPEVVYNYAVSLIREKKYNAAIPSLRNVVAQRPDMVQAWFALAECLRQTKQWTAAIEPYEKCLELQPDPKLAFHLGSCAQKARQYDKAVAAYEQALQLDPKYDKALYNMALTYRDAGRHEEAVATFDRLVELEGPTYRAYFSQGQSYFDMGRYDEALESYDMAMEQKTTANVMNAIGLVYDKLGNKKEAAVWYKKAQDLKKG